MTMNDTLDLVAMVQKAEQVAELMRQRNAEYLYDGVYVWHDGFQYWLGTEQGAEVALEHRAMEMFQDYVKRKEGK